MRVQKICASLMLSFTTLVGCNSNDEKPKEQTPALVSPVKTDEMNSKADVLLGKRDALFNMRRDLQTKREALVVERDKIRERGGDTSEMDVKARNLLSEDRKLAGMEKTLNQQMKVQERGRRELLAAVSAVSSGKGAAVTGREAGVASREKDLARREREIAKREASLAIREEGLATKWKAECAATATQTIIRTVDVKGSNYSKKDVEPLLLRARKEMAKKGLLPSDLPQQARGLETEASAGMKSGEYSRARLAASQLLSTVRSTKIDKSFIANKIGRLNVRMRGKTLSKKAESLFREATAAYGDAKFKMSNAKLNRISASL